MKLLLVVAAALAVASCANDSMVDSEFNAWKLQFERSYNSSSEEAERMEIWLRNREVVLRHNAMADQGNSSYRLGMTNFADMEHEEFQRSVSQGGCLTFPNTSRPRQGSTFQRSKTLIRQNDTVDWREKGYVTPVKDQRDCGSCWAFSAIGSLEGQHFKKTGKLVCLSEQQLVDCSGDYGNQGCQGGYPEEAFNYIKDNGGVNTEESYPYKAQNGECRVKNNTIGASCTGYVHIPDDDEDALKEAVATIGPISVAIHSSDQLSHLYTSGVYDEPGCSSTALNHAVLIVGYGEEGGKEYWLVKNSWGTSWGEKGYIKMRRNSSSQCGIASAANFPLVSPPVSNLNATHSFNIEE